MSCLISSRLASSCLTSASLSSPRFFDLGLQAREGRFQLEHERGRFFFVYRGHHHLLVEPGDVCLQGFDLGVHGVEVAPDLLHPALGDLDFFLEQLGDRAIGHLVADQRNLFEQAAQISAHVVERGDVLDVLPGAFLLDQVLGHLRGHVVVGLR